MGGAVGRAPNSHRDKAIFSKDCDALQVPNDDALPWSCCEIENAWA